MSLTLPDLYMAILIAISASGATILALRLSRPSARGTELAQTAEHVFTFENRELVAASPAAQEALNVEDLDEDIFNQMLDRLSDVFPNLWQQMDEHSPNRAAFTLRDVSTEGPLSVSVSFPGKQTVIAVHGIPAPLSRKMIMDRDQAIAAETELRTLRGTVETAPLPIWRETAQGTIDWVNRAYLRQLEASDHPDNAGAWPPPRLFVSGKVAKPGDLAEPRRKSLTMKDGSVNWYDVSAHGVGENSLHFAVGADATARAEESQRNFLQTLTKTFACLPTGIAIFDRKRQLMLFNPALTDLTSLDPVFLVLRPTLYDFLNKLREKRMVPERKDFNNWRQAITALEQSATDGTYRETWTLPNGQTYRVTGSPHPEGAVAFLFEDITAEMTLTRKFRQELELSQNLFDSLPEAIAVFGPDGIINMSNGAYHRMWDVDPQDALTQINVLDATRTWQNLCSPSPLLGDVRDFITTSGERSEWRGTLNRLDGRALHCRCAPLGRGTTLVAFSEDVQPEIVLPEAKLNGLPVALRETKAMSAANG